MAAANIIELRRLLAGKFPGLRTHAEDPSLPPQDHWLTGLDQLDLPLQGGFPRGALTEIIAPSPGAGGALLLRSLLLRAGRHHEIVALVDGADSFNVTQFEEALLPRILWVRCRSTQEALKAADLLLRDHNLPLIFIDLIGLHPAQLRKIPATTWYRFQRLIEQSSRVAVILTPQPMVAPARVRVSLQSHFSLEAQEIDQHQLAGRIELKISDAQRFIDGEARLRRPA